MIAGRDQAEAHRVGVAGRPGALGLQSDGSIALVGVLGDAVEGQFRVDVRREDEARIAREHRHLAGEIAVCGQP